MIVTEPIPVSAPRATALTTRVASDPAELGDLRAEWLNLLARSDANTVMLTPMWLATWWRVWGTDEGRQLRLVLVHDGDRLVGLAPLLRRRIWHRGVVPVRRLEALGSGERAGEGVCSDYLNIIAERGREHAVAEALATTIAADRLGRWDEFVLPAMAGDGPMPVILREAFARRGFEASVTPSDEAAFAILPAGWEAYLGAMPGKRRYYLTRSLRDYEAWAGEEGKLHEATTAAELAEGVRVLRSLHGERWGAAGQAGVFRASRFAAFHDLAMPELLRAGALELTWLSVRGEPIAAEYNLLWDNKISTYQAGRRMDLPKNIRAGLVLHLYLIRRAIAAGVREYDMLAGMSRYKMDLATGARPLVELRVVRPTLATGATRCVEGGVRWAKRVRDAIASRREAPTQ